MNSCRNGPYRRKLGLASGGLLLLGLWAGLGETANAQYGTRFDYHNPRSGFTYSQGAYYGPRYYYGGFAYATPYRSYASFYRYGSQRDRHRLGGNLRYWSGYNRSWYNAQRCW